MKYVCDVVSHSYKNDLNRHAQNCQDNWAENLKETKTKNSFEKQLYSQS